MSVLGRKSENPTPPINLLADFGGGGLTCALGVMAALLQRHQTGRGQVVDSNMVEGAAYLGSWIFKAQDTFIFGKPRGNNILDSGAHYYDTYETKDGKHVAVGSIEPNFYEKLLEVRLANVGFNYSYNYLVNLLGIESNCGRSASVR